MQETKKRRIPPKNSIVQTTMLFFGFSENSARSKKETPTMTIEMHKETTDKGINIFHLFLIFKLQKDYTIIT